jgi:L-glutamine-phosphate cytidylyltransferase
MTRAIILAAGRSSRISVLAEGRPKCLLEIGGRSLLNRLLDQLTVCGISDICIATGYRADDVAAAAPSDVKLMHYPSYATTNNLGTLQWCAQFLDGDVVVLFADVLVDTDSLCHLVHSTCDALLLVDRKRVLPGTMRVRTRDDRILDIGAHIPVNEGHGNFVGIARIGSGIIGSFRQRLSELAADSAFDNAYYTEVFRSLTAAGDRVSCVDVVGDWCEIDTAEDYHAAVAHAEQWDHAAVTAT